MGNAPQPLIHPATAAGRPRQRDASADAVIAQPQLFGRDIPVVCVASDGLDAVRAQVRQPAPALISGLADAWPALERWQPDKLKARFGDKPVRVYDASFGEPGSSYMGSVDEMPLAQFLDALLHEGRDLRMFLYNIGRQIPELLDDITFPDVGLKFSRQFVFTFFGCRGATTPLHYDIDMGHVLHTVISGRRRVRLFAPGDAAALYQHPFTVRSYVDLGNPDLAHHPALKQAQGWEVVLDAGQTLFMPAGFWHEFHYLEAGIGLSLRAGSTRLADRLQGMANLLVRSPIDRLANKLAPEHWFNWKERRAQRRGRALLEGMKEA